MARTGFAGGALALMLAPQVALAQTDMRVGAPPIPAMPPVVRTASPAMPPLPAPPVVLDRRHYVAPAYGMTLPRAWMTPAHQVADYRRFGLSRPRAGFGWSRYYDDVVLTDRWGRVYDWRGGRHARRGHGHGYDDGPRESHWYQGEAPGETITTTTVTYPERVTEHIVSYVTENAPQPTRAGRSKHRPRGKYVPVG